MEHRPLRGGCVDGERIGTPLCAERRERRHCHRPDRYEPIVVQEPRWQARIGTLRWVGEMPGSLVGVVLFGARSGGRD